MAHKSLLYGPTGYQPTSSGGFYYHDVDAFKRDFIGLKADLRWIGKTVHIDTEKFIVDDISNGFIKLKHESMTNEEFEAFFADPPKEVTSTYETKIESKYKY